eukprot:5294171-Pyramimonas_sp.AAC.1
MAAAPPSAERGGATPAPHPGHVGATVQVPDSGWALLANLPRRAGRLRDASYGRGGTSADGGGGVGRALTCSP